MRYIILLALLNLSPIAYLDLELEINSNVDFESTNGFYGKDNHLWHNYRSTYYRGNFRVKKADYNNSKYYKNNTNVYTIAQLYRNVINYDSDKLIHVHKELWRIKEAKNLSRTQFANLIVSFVQSIPYSVLVNSSCSFAYYSNDVVKELMDQGIECDGPVTGGIYSPVEFIGRFHGDCDTRTVFLYTVLKYFSYDVVILNSDTYAHSMLGINLPTSGKYKYYNNKRYYFWETTAKNYQIGMLPSSISNTNYWYVELN